VPGIPPGLFHPWRLKTANRAKDESDAVVKRGQYDPSKRPFAINGNWYHFIVRSLPSALSVPAVLYRRKTNSTRSVSLAEDAIVSASLVLAIDQDQDGP
jgi:hypothetical protein